MPPTEDVHPSTDRMASFGERLRKEREARGIELTSIAESTKISTKVLQALESNRFGDLPGRVYNRGFVRAYAEFIGADPSALLEAYEEEERRRSPMPPGNPSSTLQALAAARSPSVRRRWRAWPLLLAATASSAVAVTLALWPPRDAASSTALETSPAPARRFQDPRGTETAQPPDAPSSAGNGAQAGIGTVPSLFSGQGPEDLESRGPGESPPVPEEPVLPIPEGGPAGVEADPPPADAGAEPAYRGISVRESGIGTGIVDHDLVGRRREFAVGERVWFWTRLVGANPGDVVRHVWFHEGTIVTSVEITIGGPHWRAYTRRILEPGDVGAWTTEVRDATHRVLAGESFTCYLGHTSPQPAGAPPATP